jgi:hypothetical protein
MAPGAANAVEMPALQSAASVKNFMTSVLSETQF